MKDRPGQIAEVVLFGRVLDGQPILQGIRFEGIRRMAYLTLNDDPYKDEQYGQKEVPAHGL
jgi:hypothetical protein